MINFKLQKIENEEINHKLVDPEVIGDQNEYRKLMKEHSDLEEIVAKYGEYKKLNKEIEEAKELLGEKLDKEFKQMVDAELKEAERRLEEVKTELKILLLPKDPNDDKNVIVEIRGGAGGRRSCPLCSRSV